MDKLIFVPNAQEDPATGTLKQSTADPDSIRGRWDTFWLNFYQMPFFRWFNRSPFVLRRQKGPEDKKDDNK